MGKSVDQILAVSALSKIDDLEGFYQQILKENSDLGGEVKDIQRQAAECFGEDVLITDPAEIARRKAFSSAARKQVIRDAVELGAQRYPGKDQWRAYGILYDRNNTVEAERNNIDFHKFAGQPPSKEKGQYMFRRIKELMDRCPPDRIRSMKDMSDQELVENARDLIFANDLSGELATLTADENNIYQFSKSQLEEMKEYGDMFGAEINEVLFRLQNIIEPCYPYISPEKLMKLDDDTLANERTHSLPSRALADWVNRMPLVRYGMLENQVLRLEEQLKAEGLNLRDPNVEFTDSKNGKTVKSNDFSNVKSAMHDAIKNGRLMHLQFPNGQSRVFVADGVESGFRLRPGIAVNFRVTQNAASLKRIVENADPLLLISSREYKNMKQAVLDAQKITPLSDPPKQEEIDEMRRTLTGLKETSAEYLKVKSKQRGVTDEGKINSTRRREIARVRAAENVQKYAEIKLKQLAEEERKLQQGPAKKEGPKKVIPKAAGERTVGEAAMEETRQYKERAAKWLEDPNVSDGLKELAKGVQKAADQLESYCQGKKGLFNKDIHKAVTNLVLFEAVEKARSVQGDGEESVYEKLLNRANGYNRTVAAFQVEQKMVNFMSNFNLTKPEKVEKFLADKSARAYPNGGVTRAVQNTDPAPQRQLTNEVPQVQNNPPKQIGL